MRSAIKDAVTRGFEVVVQDGRVGVMLDAFERVSWFASGLNREVAAAGQPAVLAVFRSGAWREAGR